MNNFNKMPLPIRLSLLKALLQSLMEEDKKIFKGSDITELFNIAKQFMSEKSITSIPKEFMGAYQDDVEDDAEKEIGDTVKINHPSLVFFMLDYVTGKQVASMDTGLTKEDKELVKHKAVVTAFEDFFYDCGHCSSPHKASMVIYFPHNKKRYRTNENNVHLVKSIE